jgi:hypothetical protein
MSISSLRWITLLTTLALLPGIVTCNAHVREQLSKQQYIVQARSMREARRGVLGVGGEIRRELQIVHGVVTAGYTWSKGYTWTRNVPWSATGAPANAGATSMSIESWAPNE